MREIISTFIGQYGVQSGEKFWDQICVEHNINYSGEKICQQKPQNEQDYYNYFFSESIEQKYVPRAVFADLDPTPIYELKKARGSLFSNDSFISGKEDSSSNSSRAKYSMSKIIQNVVLESIRKEAEKCDYLQGFMLHRSLSGGTGVGLGSNIVQQLSAHYPKVNKINCLLFPSNSMSNEIVDPYNFVLSIHDILEHSDGNILLTNESLYNYIETHIDVEYPDYSNLNKLIGQINSSITSSIRFGGELNFNIPNLCCNLVPYPRLSLLLPSYSSSKSKIFEGMSDPNPISICSNAFKKQNFLVDCNPNLGKYLACSLMVRGSIVPKEIYESIKVIKSKQNVKFIDFSPTGIKVGVNFKQPINIEFGVNKQQNSKDALVLGNNTAVSTTLDSIARKFDSLFAKRAFVHWFVGEGMESGEFYEAREDLHSLYSDYCKVAAEDNENQQDQE